MYLSDVWSYGYMLHVIDYRDRTVAPIQKFFEKLDEVLSYIKDNIKTGGK